ncbi:phage tail domain-containing protein [Staphylococcus pseudintermedius]|uniref:phage tail domain-containing protein n=1 Tax=Staphylococcus pseudintermedius TaxID=283734 RepID=UPI003F74EEF4
MEYEDKYAKIDGLHGRYLVDSVFVKRKIAIPCLFVTDNNSDYVKQRTLLYSIVQDTEPFYIRELRKRLSYTQYTFEHVNAGDIYYHGNVALDQFNMYAFVIK